MRTVITEFGNVKRLFEANYLFQFSPEDVRFVITGYSMDSQIRHQNLSKLMLKSLEARGFLEVVDLSAAQNQKAYDVFFSNRNILFECVAALVYADDKKLSFMSEDTNVMDFAYKNFGIDVHSSGKLNRVLKDLLFERSKKKTNMELVHG